MPKGSEGGRDATKTGGGILKVTSLKNWDGADLCRMSRASLGTYRKEGYMSGIGTSSNKDREAKSKLLRICKYLIME